VRAYYFTSARWGLDNLTKRRLKISMLSELNDPFELLALDLSDEAKRTAYLDSVRYCVERYGVICFSRAFANPLLWSHYGDRHRGMCLAFELFDDLVMPISYSVERLKPDVEMAIESDTLDSTVNQVFSTKFRDWAYEDEVRAWVNLHEREETTGLFFADLGSHLRLEEVILGAKCETRPEEVVATLGNLVDVRLFRAHLSFSGFIVEKVQIPVNGRGHQ
jgi:hypothetical protein